MEIIASIFTTIGSELSQRPIFWLISIVMLFSGFMVVTLKNIFHCALYLVLCLFSVAGLFILLDAEFLAAAQVLIYVGAVAILMIFAIMLSTDLASQRVTQTSKNSPMVAFICIFFAFSSAFLAKVTTGQLPALWNNVKDSLPAENIFTIGSLLMTDFMLPFEVVSILLLAAMIGAIVLARKENT